MVYILTGVSGSGKSTIGRELAKVLKIPFYDADLFHPRSNVEKMSRGIPLTDQDRLPWLKQLSEQIRKWEKQGDCVLACSALKKSYREILSQGIPEKVKFIFLQGSIECIRDRIRLRKGHYMPPSLLESQFETLEIPGDAITVSIENSPGLILENIIRKLKGN